MQTSPVPPPLSRRAEDQALQDDPDEGVPHGQVVITLALHGTVALVAVNPFVSYWNYLTLAAMYLITLIVYATQRPITGRLWRDVGPVAGLWTVVFLVTPALQAWLGEFHLLPSLFVIGVTLVVSMYWLVSPTGE